MKRLDQLRRITSLLGVFRNQVELAGALNHTDIHRVAEDVLKALLRDIWNLNQLENLNLWEEHNFPGIDLGDKWDRVAVQVTSQADSEKVKGTLRQFVGKDLYTEYDRLIMLIVGKKQGSYSGSGFSEILDGKLTFDKEKDILDFRDLMRDVEKLDDEHLDKVQNYLESQFNPALQNQLEQLVNSLSGSGFVTWQAAMSRHERTKLGRSTIDLTGRDETLNTLVEWVNDSSVRAVVISGPTDMGKTRLALEATRHRFDQTLVALDPDAVRVTDLQRYVDGKLETVLVIEDPDQVRIERLIEEALYSDSLKLIITLPTASDAPTTNYGRDERIQNIKLTGLDDENSYELLKAAGTTLDYSTQSWVIGQASGNPGILLYAATSGSDLRRESNTFAEDIAKALQRRAEREMGGDFEYLYPLSIFTYVGIADAVQGELDILLSRFGSHDLSSVLRALPGLEDAGLIQIRGSYAEVTPNVLANHLAKSVLQGNYPQLVELFAVLSPAAQKRFIDRLVKLKMEESESLWRDLLGQGGIFVDFSSALSEAKLLRQLASAAPQQVAQLIFENLRVMSLWERLALQGDTRRQLMWTLDQLLFRTVSSEAALRSVMFLAEAENESYGNNATGVFQECFLALHPQFPLPLDIRSSIVAEMLSEGASEKHGLLALQAIKAALENQAFVTLRRSEGFSPLAAPPRMTYGDVHDYLEKLLGLLVTAAYSGKDKVAEQAKSLLPNLLYMGAIHARYGSAISYMVEVSTLVVDQGLSVNITQLLEAFQYTQLALHQDIQKAQQAFTDAENESAKKDISAQLEELQGYLDRVDVLVNRIEDGDFSMRLKVWVGDQPHGAMEKVTDQDGNEKWRANLEHEGLAMEALETPSLLASDLLVWLVREAKNSRGFFFYLGLNDTDKYFASSLKAFGENAHGAEAFGAYFGGVSRHDPNYVTDLLDEASVNSDIRVSGIVSTMKWLINDPTGVERLERLFKEGRLTGLEVKQHLMYQQWWTNLDDDAFLRILGLVAGENLEDATEVIDALAFRVHEEKPIDGPLADLAWCCLHEANQVSLNNHWYDFDKVAAKLAETDSERGFQLLADLLVKDQANRSWEPLKKVGALENTFWLTLLEIDRERAIRTALEGASAARQNPRVGKVIDDVFQEQDMELLVKLIEENESYAEAIAEALTAKNPGFWRIALKLIEDHSENANIRFWLDFALQTMAGPWGPLSSQRQQIADTLDEIVANHEMSSTARHWLEKKRSQFLQSMESDLLREANEDVEGWERFANEASPFRSDWAIKTLLMHQKVGAVLRICSKDELLKKLPDLGFSTGEAENLRVQIIDANG